MTGSTPTNSARRADELHEINESVRSGDWAHPDSLVLPGGLTALGPAPNPLDALAHTGIPGLVERLAPLREAQRWFAGDPDAVTEYVDKWLRVAALAREAGDRFGSTVREHTAEWSGAAGDQYRQKAATQQGDLDVLVEAAAAIAVLVTSAGDMAGSSRAHIQESVTQCVHAIVDRLPDYYTVLNGGHPAALNYVLADVSAIVDAWS